VAPVSPGQCVPSADRRLIVQNRILSVDVIHSPRNRIRLVRKLLILPRTDRVFAARIPATPHEQVTDVKESKGQPITLLIQ
jgi:hypothetical protein